MPGRIVGILAFIAAATVAGCGSTSASLATHSSPAGAVHGFVNAVRGDQLDAAEGWVAPAGRQQYAAFFRQAKLLGLTVHFRVSDFNVLSERVESAHPDRAHVATRGELDVCVDGPALSSPTCSPFQGSESDVAAGGSSDDDYLCTREGGRWYISIDAPLPLPAQ